MTSVAHDPEGGGGRVLKHLLENNKAIGFLINTEKSQACKLMLCNNPPNSKTSFRAVGPVMAHI